MANPQVIVEFIAKTDKLRKGLSQAESSSLSAGDKIKGMGRTALRVAGAAGLGALVATLKIGVDEFTQATKLAAQTEAVIKSTGGAAHVTAKHVEDMAHALQQKSGVDEKTIQSGENLLLTFTNIRNSTGKNNKIFDQATRVLLDMSVALGQDTKTSAIQLGKALNDPIKGVTSLQRVGVQFSVVQKQQIKDFVDAGNTMGAQKVILAELNKEFGGSAEAMGKTMPGQMNILKENYNELAGTIVKTVLPPFQAVAAFFVKYPGLMRAVVIAVLALAAALVVMNVALTVTAVVASPITLIVLGIVAAVAALVAIGWVLYTNWSAIAKGLGVAFDAIKNAATAVIDWLKAHWTEILLGVLMGPFGLAAAEVIKHWAEVRSAIQTGVNTIIDWVNGRFNAIFQSGWNLANGLVQGVLGALTGIGWAAWGIINNIGEVAAGQAANVYNWGWGVLRNMWDGMLASLAGIGWAAWNVVAGIGSVLASQARAVFQWGWNAGSSIVNGLLSALRGAYNAIMGAIKGPINAVIRAWNGIQVGGWTIKTPGPIPDIHMPSIKFPDLPYLAQGGIVTGPTLAMIGEAGPEAVVPLSQHTPPVQVRVFIGDQELTHIVRTEVVGENNRVAQTLLAGLAYG